MRILVSNDDGYQSPGIQVLTQSLRKLGHEVWVVAPQRDRSTVGHSLTLHKPLRMQSVGTQEYFVSGSPADCVYMATRFVMKDALPDLVVSGINQGANLGNDIFYSGTVAAAREGLMFGIPSVAISLCCGLPERLDPSHRWEGSEMFVQKYFNQLIEEKAFSTEYLTNISIPDTSADKIKGMKITKQGRRFYSDLVREATDPRNKKYYWVGGSYEGFDKIEGTDCVAVNDGYVSLTPLRIDTTYYDGLERMAKVEEIPWS